MTLESRKILVTGAGGFIGSHLCEELVKTGANVRAFVKYNSSDSHGLLETLPEKIYRELEVVPGDTRDTLRVGKAVRGCNIVLHLAALIGIPYSYEAPDSYVDTNITGTVNVLQACLDSGVERLVHTSTSEVYGTARYVPIDEEHPLQAQSPYAATKIAADKLAESYHNSFGLPVVTIRPFNCFGPRQSARAFIPAMISQIMETRKVCCGSLSPLRDYTFVKDTVNAFQACAYKPGIEGQTINVGSGKKISMGELLKIIMERTGNQREVVTVESRRRPQQSEVMELMCDNAKARKLLDWSPSWSLEDGIDAVVDYVKQNLGSYKTLKYVV
jgi:NAD dependent epimerase/dehydratase